MLFSLAVVEILIGKVVPPPPHIAFQWTNSGRGGGGQVTGLDWDRLTCLHPVELIPPCLVVINEAAKT